MTVLARVALVWPLALLLGCSAASAPGPTGPGVPVLPTASTSATATASAGGAVDTPEEAVAAVARFDSNFLGYPRKDPDLIGQSAWVDVTARDGGFELTFFRGSGDCPAGCIDRMYAKFVVHADGTVQKRCEWQQGSEAKGTPC